MKHSAQVPCPKGCGSDIEVTFEVWPDPSPTIRDADAHIELSELTCSSCGELDEVEKGHLIAEGLSRIVDRLRGE